MRWRLPDTSALETFVALAESDSMTDVAQRLGVTQSAISQCLQQLEKHMGVVLVIRRKKPVQLTPAGRVLKQRADMILGELRRLKSSVREAANQGAIQCRLGLVTSCSEVFGSRLIGRLEQSTEHVSLKSGLTPGLVELFMHREIDLLISDNPMQEVPGVEVFELFHDPIVVAIPEHFLGGQGMQSRDTLDLAELSEHFSLIKYGRNTNIGTYSEVVMRRLKLLPQVRYETDDSHTLMNFVCDGLGWGMLSALCAAQCIHRLDKVSIFELDKSRHYRSIYLVARAGELGDIPERVAETIRQIMQEDVVPRLKFKAPWIKKSFFELKP
ncbi:LysR family transcriptional regulator [Oceanospirillum linum]|uniref:LysR family transcriptional regulator n=1 Tax=Oceanospirillum linum TaxID=966 RepID=A0A1T1H974_OCELI|nr:LysR family transcriptional regulator [Oceanospirillum linum]OOV86398.1 LysR family transcriptional regulator [Oceanospirillum linum]SEG32186.1 DNA-binding transcriptional regulator, LysR family [Oleiphilus messinensis]SMP28627.1 DNA-binding transcriptional regulator, LysR family [Oceanospirillum linum]